MSGQTHLHPYWRCRRLAGVLGKAAAIALIGSSSTVFAHPFPETLNGTATGGSSSVHWFADWQVNTNPAPTDFFATPFATNSTIVGVKSQLTLSANAGRPLGIKVQTPLSNASASSLFSASYGVGNKAISYVFGDFESAGSLVGTSTNLANISQLVQQVQSSSWASRAYVGEFGLVPLAGVGFGTSPSQDPTRRGSLMYTMGQYQSSKVNMANTDLYPGSPTYRNKSTGDWANANIRTGLFIAPIGRMTAVQNNLNDGYNGRIKSIQNGDGGAPPQYDKQIPWVTRFNNAGNQSLDTDNNPANGYRFVPGAALPSAGLSGAQTANQMMGRGDFSAQILHYRMRGAYSINLFEPGNVGYTAAMQQQDARDGWYGASDPHIAHVNNIFAQADSKPATMTLNPTVDGTITNNGIRSESSGTIWSGEYSVSGKQLDVLDSNLDTADHLIKFGSVDVYDVFTLRGSGVHANDTYDDSPANQKSISLARQSLIEAGMHHLLQFDLVTSKVYSNSSFTGKYKTQVVWLLSNNYQVFTNNNRNDVGIPEPTTFGMLAAAGSMAAVCRRQRRKDAQ
jgi:hypothetical protein